MFEERCYQKFPSPLVWWAAENYCQSLGGHLAAVNTPQENGFLRDNIGNGWIGMKIGAVLIKKEREKIVNFTWSDGSPAGDAFREQDISFDGFPEYILRFNDPFCAFLEDHGPWSLQPCSLIEKEFICEKVMKNVWGTDQWYDVSCDERATRSFICKRAAGRVTRPGDNG
uniref:C-type lectin domain-containing protein n=1 Tax=Branchiostoma floridae TaxID=7739 RepID=C3ZI82_BRAFL|eukprot:XP_002591596.1 hypothetical protein BRAFLDRAFT_80692 [Branchiostoma floridae]